MPNTMAEVEEYLGKELSFNADDLLRTNKENIQLCSMRKMMKKQGMSKLLKVALTSLRFLLLGRFVWALAGNVLAQETRGQGFLGMPFWWAGRKIHRLISYFHYSICPQTLTLDGTLDLLVTGNPDLENVPMELYSEIFGSKASAPFGVLPEKALRRFSDMERHLPRMQIDD